MQPRRHRSFPRWTPRVAVHETATALTLWPHAVPVPQRWVTVCWDRAGDVLEREIYVWLRRNARCGRWQFTMTNSPEPLAFRVRFMDPDEAFAFKMRWG